MNMTTKTYIQKDGTVWEWEETKELIKYIKEMHQTNNGDSERWRQDSPEKIKES